MVSIENAIKYLKKQGAVFIIKYTNNVFEVFIKNGFGIK